MRKNSIFFIIALVYFTAFTQKLFYKRNDENEPLVSIYIACKFIYYKNMLQHFFQLQYILTFIFKYSSHHFNCHQWVMYYNSSKRCYYYYLHFTETFSFLSFPRHPFILHTNTETLITPLISDNSINSINIPLWK